MNQDMQLRLVITADGKVAVQEVNRTAGSFQALTDQQKKASQGAQQVADSVGSINSQLSALKGLAAGAFSVDAIFQAYRGYKDLADTVTLLDARLRLATSSNQDFRNTSEDLFQLAQRMGVAYATMGGSFSRIAITVRELGGTSAQAIKLTEILAATAKLSGASAQEQASAAQQFAQALGSGVLQGDELRSILENNQRLSRALADGLGKSTAELRQLGEEGKLTADVVARAILSQAPRIQAELSSIATTYAMAAERITNETTAIIGEFSRMGSESSIMAAVVPALETIRETLQELRQNAEDSGRSLRAGLASADVARNIEILTSFIRDLNSLVGYVSIGLEMARHTITGVITDVVLGVQAVTAATTGNYTKFAEDLKRRNDTIEASFNRMKGVIDSTLASVDRFNNANERSAEKQMALASLMGVDTRAENRRLGLTGAALLGDNFGADANVTRIKKEFEKYGETVMLASEKLAKQMQKKVEELRPIKQQLQSVILSGDPEASAKARAQLEELTAIEIKTVTDAQRKIAEAKKTEANRLGADAKKDAEASYRERIEMERRLQAAIDADAKNAIDVQRAKYEAHQIDARAYYEGVANLETIAIDLKQASLERELAMAKAGGITKKKEAAEYVAKIAALEEDRVRVTQDANAKILAADRKYWADRIEADRRAEEAVSALYQGTADLIKAQIEAAQQREFDLSLYGMTEEAQKRAIALRKIEIDRTKELEKALRDYEVAKKAAADSPAGLEAAKAAYDQRVRAIEQATAAEREGVLVMLEQKAQLDLQKTFWDGLFNSIKGGWKGVRDFVKNFFFDWLISQLKQQFILNIGYNLQGSGGIGGMLSGLGSLFGGQNTGIMGTLFGSSGTATAAASSGLLGSLLGQMPFVAGAGPIAAGTGLAGILSNMGLTSLANGVAQLANFIPVVGPIIAIASTLLPRLFNNKDGLWFDINGRTPGGHPENQFTTALGSTIQLHGEGAIADAKPFVAQFQNLAQNFVDIFGKEIAGRASAVVNEFWTGFSARGRGTEYTNAQEYAAALAKEGTDVLAEYFSRAFSVVDTRIANTISAWSGSTEDLVNYIQTVLQVQASINQQGPLLQSIIGSAISLTDVLNLQKEGEKLSDTFNRILGTFSITNQIAELLGKGADAFGAVGLASLEARERVVALAGGLQSLGTDVQTYLEKFFSADERASMQRELARKQVEAAFSDLNLSVPTTREQFRALVASLDLSTESGQRTFVALMKISGAFDLLMGAANEAGDPVYTIVRHTRSFGEAAVTAGEQIAEAAVSIGLSIGTVLSQGQEQAAALLAQMSGIIDAGNQDLTTRLTRKMAAAAQLSAQYAAQYDAYLAQHGGIVDATALALAAARDYLAAQVSGFAGDLAQLATLTAQYGTQRAEQLLELERWHREQVALAGGNAALLLAIEESYQARRTAIINGGVASGLSSLQQTLRDWLNGLLLNQQLTQLTPMQQLAEARSQYEAALASGDGAAISRAADAYLSIARSVYASSAAYQAIYDAVIAQVRALINGGTVPALPPAPAAQRLAQSSTFNAGAAASGAAQALNTATAAASDVLANLMAATKFAVEAEGQASRDNAEANAQKIVAAIGARGLQRVEV